MLDGPLERFIEAEKVRRDKKREKSWKDLPAHLMARPQESLEWFLLCRSTDFQHLPFGPCWADQPDWLIHDFQVLAERMGYLRSVGKKTERFREKALKKLGMSDFRR